MTKTERQQAAHKELMYRMESDVWRCGMEMCQDKDKVEELCLSCLCAELAGIKIAESEPMP